MSTVRRVQNKMSRSHVKIYPNDQSLVGKFIKSNLWQDYFYGEVLFVGSRKVLLRMSDGDEEVFPILGSSNQLEWWEIFKLKPKIKSRGVRIKDFRVLLS